MGKDVQPLQRVKNWYTSRAQGQEWPWGFLHRRWWFLCVKYAHCLLFSALHYLCHIDHEIVGAIQSSCYTCGVRHGLTLAISLKPQEKFRLVINQSVGSCREKLIPEVRSYLSAVCYQGYLFYIKYVIYLCIVFWYYPLFVAICESWLLKLTYGAYLVLSLKSDITSYNQSNTKAHTH